MRSGRCSVLLVEDNPADAELTRDALTEGRADLDVEIAEDGLEAFTYLKSRADARLCLPDLVIVDLNMPRMSGKDFLADLRRDERFRAMPVIVLTTSAAEHDIDDSYRLGANSYVHKPMELNSFRDAVRHLQDFWFSVACLPGNQPGGAGG